MIYWSKKQNSKNNQKTKTEKTQTVCGSLRLGGGAYDDIGRSVGRSVGQALGRSVPPPPSPQNKCGVILHLVCVSFV